MVMPMATNATDPRAPHLGRPQSSARKWFEPLLIICIMLASLYFNRLRNYNILGDNRPIPSRSPSTESLLSEHHDDPTLSTPSKPPRRFFGCSIRIPDTSRFTSNIHSRLLQKFPFLVEMFYWALNYLAYSFTKKIAAILYSRSSADTVAAMAQDNGIRVLDLEHHSLFSIFFPVHEVDFQQYFIRNHGLTMTFFNQIYSLVHIPGTVLFLSWYYYAAPSHATFAVGRRTMVLGNFLAFGIFCLYPCMPPRLLPKSFGFEDTVRQGHAESVWTGGSNVNELAAMPSLHFTYAFIVGTTFIYHSGALPGSQTWWRKDLVCTAAFVAMGLLYPVLVLTVIVATANHYWLDAVVATLTVGLAFAGNRIWMVLLPAERLLCWVLRVSKPVPSTGQWHRKETFEEERNESNETYV